MSHYTSRPSPQHVLEVILRSQADEETADAVQDRLIALGLNDGEAEEAQNAVQCAKLHALGVGFASELLERLRTHPVFVAAVAHFGGNPGPKLPDPQNLQQLMTELYAPEPERRIKALATLGRVDDPSASALLMSGLHDRDTAVRVQAVQSIRSRRAYDAVPMLVAILCERGTPDELVSAILWALAELRDPQAVPALVHTLMHPNPAHRRFAAWALGEIGDPSAIPALQASLCDYGQDPAIEDEFGTVSHQAASALRRLGCEVH